MGTYEVVFPAGFNGGPDNEGGFYVYVEKLQRVSTETDSGERDYLVGGFYYVGDLVAGHTNRYKCRPVDYAYWIIKRGRTIHPEDIGYTAPLVTGLVSSWRVSDFGRGVYPIGASVQDNRLILYTSTKIYGSAIGNPFYLSNIKYPQEFKSAYDVIPRQSETSVTFGLYSFVSTEPIDEASYLLGGYSGNVLNTDPFNFTIGSNEPLEIRFVASLRDVIIGTSDGIYVNRVEGLLGPRNVGFIKQVKVPCDSIFAVSSKYIFFSTNNGSTLEMISYVRSSGAFVNTEISIMSEDLYEGRKIKKLSFNYLSKILFVLFEDGGLVGLTIEDGANIRGHTRFTFPGDVSDLAYLEDFNKTVLYFIPQHSPDVLYGFLDSEIQVVNPVTGDADITSWLAVDNSNIAGNPRIEQANADSRFFFNERNSPNLFLWDLDAFPKTDKEYLYFQRTYTSMTPKTVWAVEGYFFAQGTTVRAFFNNDLSSLEFPGNEDDTITLPFAVDEVTIGYIIQPEIRTLYLAPPQNQVPGGRGMQVFTQRVDLVGIRLFRTDQFEIRILSQEDREDDINTPVETSGQGDEIPLLAPDSRYYKVQVGSSMDIAPRLR